jgi:hypothetical protein
MRHRGRAGSDGTSMSAETKQWLVEVALVLLTAIALVCARGQSAEQADSNDAPPASVNSND